MSLVSLRSCHGGRLLSSWNCLRCSCPCIQPRVGKQDHCYAICPQWRILRPAAPSGGSAHATLLGAQPQSPIFSPQHLIPDRLHLFRPGIAPRSVTMAVYPRAVAWVTFDLDIWHDRSYRYSLGQVRRSRS